MNSCFFIGHADAPESVFAQLTQTVERLIVKENIRYFYVGGYGNFDRLAALTVKRLKKTYRIILRSALSPFPMDLTELTTRRVWKPFREDMLLSEQTEKWLKMLTGRLLMCATQPAIPEVSWNTRSAVRKQDKSIL